MTGARRRRPDVWTAVALLGWATVALLLLYPLSSVVLASVTDDDGGWTLANYAAVLSRPRYVRALGNTALAGLGGAAGAVVLGVTLAHLTTRYALRGAGLVFTLAVVALCTPPFIGAYAWIVLLGANGIVRTALAGWGIDVPAIYGAGGVVLVFSLKFFPQVFLLASAGFKAIDPALEEAAESLGLSPVRRFFAVTLPLVMPALSAAAMLAFVLCIADFGTPRLLGRGFQTLATEAFVLFASELGGNPGLASAMSMVLLAASVVLVVAQRRLSRSTATGGQAHRTRPVLQPRGWRTVLVHAVAYGIVGAGALPGLVVVAFSFRRANGPVFADGFGLGSYERVLRTVPQAIGNSLLFAALAVAGILVVGVLTGYVAARRRTALSAAYEAVLVLPYIVPGIVVGIGFVGSFNTGPLPLTGTGAIIVLAVLIRRLPYATRATTAALGQLSPSLEQAAVSLGLHPVRAFARVTVPLILPGIVAGALMSFVTAMNELSASLVLYVGSTVTMPVGIYLLVLDGQYGAASAMSAILLGATAVLVYGAFALAGRDGRALV